MKIHLVGADVFHANKRMEGQTNMTNLIVAFLNFAKASKKGINSASILILKYFYLITV